MCKEYDSPLLLGHRDMSKKVGVTEKGKSGQTVYQILF